MGVVGLVGSNGPGLWLLQEDPRGGLMPSFLRVSGRLSPGATSMDSLSAGTQFCTWRIPIIPEWREANSPESQDLMRVFPGE